MRRRLQLSITGIALLLILGMLPELQAQTAIPQRFSYQGIARMSDGLPMVNKSIRIRFSILDASVIGNVVYMEEQQALTNEFGLFTLQVGGGQPQIGTFSTVNWGGNVKFLKVEMDAGSEGTYDLLGTTQLLSVPYALAAGKPTDLKLNELADVNVQNALNGQVLQYNGNSWIAGGSSSNSTVVTSARLSGTGSSTAPLDIARNGATFDQVLKWNGTEWLPKDDEGEDLMAGPGIIIVNKEITHAQHSGDVSGSVNLTVTGLNGRPLINIPPVSGQVLKYIEGQGWIPGTDNNLSLIPGNGIELSGQTISSDLWLENGQNIYRLNGNVGIGTGSPTQQLTISKNFQLGGAFMPGSTAGLAGQLLVSNGTNVPPLWMYPKDAVKDVVWLTTGNAGTTISTDYIGTSDNTPLLVKTNGVERIRVGTDGNVGIGASTPGARLTVGGDVYVNSSANGVILRSPNNSCWRITVDNNGNLSTTQISCP